MIFFSYKGGQLGNRLFTFAHLIATATANNLKVVNLSFDEYAQYFQTTRQDVFCRYPSVVSALKSSKLRSWAFIFNKAVLKLLRNLRFFESSIHLIVVADLPEYQFSEDRHFDLNTQSFRDRIKKKPVTFLFGRFFRDYHNLEKYQNVIRDFFKPLPEIQASVNQFIDQARRNTDLLVGVHIRRGDYEQFANGKYFYSQKEYATKMKELQANVIGKKIAFLLCSDEEIKSGPFEGLIFCRGPGHLVKDMYAFSQCDLIFGPPSTFTLWASFYGQKPLYQMKDLNDPINLKSFVILPPQILYNFSFN